jgi:hypothetical protein
MGFVHLVVFKRTAQATNTARHWGATPPARRSSQKKTDMAEHPQVFCHIGLLFNEPPGTARLLFI